MKPEPFPPIPILFVVIGTASYLVNAVLPLAMEVLLTVPCCIGGEEQGLLWPCAPYSQRELERELQQRYGLMLAKDASLTRDIQSQYNGRHQYLHYPLFWIY